MCKFDKDLLKLFVNDFYTFHSLCSQIFVSTKNKIEMAEENIPLANWGNQSQEKTPKRFLQTISQWDPNKYAISLTTTTSDEGREASCIKNQELIKILNNHCDKLQQNKHMNE